MKVKGNIIKARIGFVKDRFGEAGWEKVLSSLSASDRTAINSVLNVSWYDFGLGERLDKAIVSALGAGDTRIFEDIGRASARENLRGVHSNFLKPADPLKFLEKAPMIYRFYYDVGHRTWEQTGPASGFLTTYDSDTFSVADCATVIGWHKEALAMLGATNVAIVEETCRARGGTVCRYKVTWS